MCGEPAVRRHFENVNPVNNTRKQKKRKEGTIVRMTPSGDADGAQRCGGGGWLT